MRNDVVPQVVMPCWRSKTTVLSPRLPVADLTHGRNTRKATPAQYADYLAAKITHKVENVEVLALRTLVPLGLLCSFYFLALLAVLCCRPSTLNP